MKFNKLIKIQLLKSEKLPKIPLIKKLLATVINSTP